MSDLLIQELCFIFLKPVSVLVLFLFQESLFWLSNLLLLLFFFMFGLTASVVFFWCRIQIARVMESFFFFFLWQQVNFWCALSPRPGKRSTSFREEESKGNCSKYCLQQQKGLSFIPALELDQTGLSPRLVTN